MRALINLIVPALTAFFLFSQAQLLAEQKTDQAPKEIVDLSLEELMEMEITSASRKEQSLKSAPTAIYVITKEDIRRSTANTLPDLLRIVPGLNVSQVSAHEWAISARGFNGLFANKLLVLIDGRAVYSPIFSGTYWDVQQVMLEDLERIEVIRGPGATVWGANAVNGVINIISKHASETLGTLATAGVGSHDRFQGSLRSGYKMAEDAYLRASVSGFDRDNSKTNSSENHDQFGVGHGSTRADWKLNEQDSIMLQSDVYAGRHDERLQFVALQPPFQFDISDKGYFGGGDILSRWKRQDSSSSSSELQFYYDHSCRNDAIMHQRIDTLDLDFSRHQRVSDRHDLVYGVGLRNYNQDLIQKRPGPVDPIDSKTDSLLVSTFLQDEIILLPEQVTLSVGSKLEHNDYTGFELQPSARIAWTPNADQTLWASIARAVRTPSRIEDGADIALTAVPLPTGDTAYTAWHSDREDESEDLLAYEVGYRMTPSENVSLDLASYYNSYRDLHTFEAGQPTLSQADGVPFLEIPLYNGNLGKAQTYGFEAVIEYKPYSWIRFQASNSLAFVTAWHIKNSNDEFLEIIEGDSPKHKTVVRALLNPLQNWEFDVTLRYVDALTRVDNVGSYLAGDLRVGWKARSNLDLSLSAVNLIGANHREYNDFVASARDSEAPRAVFGRVTWKF